MKNVRLLFPLCLVLIMIAGSAHADLNIFLGDLNNRASASPIDYNTRLSTQFGVPQPQVSSLVRSVATPSDAFMVLQLAQMLGLPHDRVLYTYNANRGKGWGVIAKELGIKPGSAQFHALKNGDFSLTGTPGMSSGKGQGKDKGMSYGFGQEQDQEKGPGKGKGKGHNK